MIKAVIFDLGGVFFEDGTKKCMMKLVSETGKSMEFLELVYRGEKGILYRENKLSADEFFKWAADQIGGLSPQDLNRRWVSEYTQIQGTRDIVEKLRKAGLKLGVISDNVPERFNYLEAKYRFAELFDDILLSYETNMTKLSPEVFQLSLSNLKVSPSETIFVDDKQMYIDTALSVGLGVILFENPEQLALELKERRAS